MIAVDTNVFIYALDADDPAKQTKAQDLLQRLMQTASSVVLPWQVACEMLGNLRKREAAGRISSTMVEAHFANIFAMFPLAIPSAAVLQKYFDLFSRFSLSHWDAMLLAACKEAGVTALYSEDMDATTDYDGLRVINPFV